MSSDPDFVPGATEDTEDTKLQRQIAKIKARKKATRKPPDKSYKQSYRRQWESKPEFAGWITRGEDKDHARCVWCAKELNAHAATLKHHANSFNHKKRAAVLDRSGSVGDNSGGNGATNFSVVFRRNGYKREWEEEPELAGWLAEAENGMAFCGVCRVKVVPNRCSINAHAKGKKHLAKMEANKGMEDWGDDNGKKKRRKKKGKGKMTWEDEDLWGHREEEEEEMEEKEMEEEEGVVVAASEAYGAKKEVELRVSAFEALELGFGGDVCSLLKRHDAAFDLVGEQSRALFKLVLAPHFRAKIANDMRDAAFSLIIEEDEVFGHYYSAAAGSLIVGYLGAASSSDGVRSLVASWGLQESDLASVVGGTREEERLFPKAAHLKASLSALEEAVKACLPVGVLYALTEMEDRTWLRDRIAPDVAAGDWIGMARGLAALNSDLPDTVPSALRRELSDAGNLSRLTAMEPVLSKSAMFKDDLRRKREDLGDLVGNFFSSLREICDDGDALSSSLAEVFAGAVEIARAARFFKMPDFLKKTSLEHLTAPFFDPATLEEVTSKHTLMRMLDWRNKRGTLRFWSEVHTFGDSAGNFPLRVISGPVLKVLSTPLFSPAVTDAVAKIRAGKRREAKHLQAELLEEVMVCRVGMENMGVTTVDFKPPKYMIS